MPSCFFFFEKTQDGISESRAAFEKKTLSSLTSSIKNSADIRYIPLTEENSGTYAIYDGQRLGTILSAASQDGYSGGIKLLIALDNEGSILGVHVTEHQETPGLGDKIEAVKSPWSKQFIGKKFLTTTWDIKKNDGDFDALSGATISSRAVISAVKDSIEKWRLIERE